MNIDYLVQLLGNRLNALTLTKDQAFMAGDLERINTIDVEINSVIDTLARLNLLKSISQAAADHVSTEAEIIAAGVTAVKNNTVNKDKAIFLGEYDISSYATDPLHEQKVANILSAMDIMTSAEQVDLYIQTVAFGSPVTGKMVIDACRRYQVPVNLVMALIQQDSSFATAGVAMATYNPGNVGNTGTETKLFPSWEEGVMAVAEWLSRHRILKSEEVTQEAAKPVEEIKVVAPVENATSTEEVIVPEESTEIATSTDDVVVPEANATSTEE